MARSSKIYASLQQVSRRHSQGTEDSLGPTSSSELSRRSSQAGGGFIVLPDGQRRSQPDRRLSQPSPGGGITIPDRRASVEPDATTNLVNQHDTTTPVTGGTIDRRQTSQRQVSISEQVSTKTEQYKAPAPAGITLSLEMLLGLVVLWLLTLIGSGLIGYSLSGDNEPQSPRNDMFGQQNPSHVQVTPPSSAVAINNDNAGSFILILSSVGGSSDLAVARDNFQDEADKFNQLAMDNQAPPHFAVRTPSSGGLQLVYGGDGNGSFGVNRGLAENIRNAVRNNFPDARLRDLNR